MNGDVANPPLEQPSAIRHKVDNIDSDFGDLRRRAPSIEQRPADRQHQLASPRRDDACIHERLDRQGGGPDRFERRLDLTGTSV